jgi:hypothetical protein
LVGRSGLWPGAEAGAVLLLGFPTNTNKNPNKSGASKRTGTASLRHMDLFCFVFPTARLFPSTAGKMKRKCAVGKTTNQIFHVPRLAIFFSLLAGRCQVFI